MLKEFIKNSPNFIEKPARYIYASIPDYIRYGKNFRKQYKFLEKSQWWTREQHEEYQMLQIKRLLEHAYKNVPYYTRTFNEREIKPEDIKCFNDLKKLPYLTKDVVRSNLEDLVARNYDRTKLEMHTTSGTSAMPMDFYIEPKIDEIREWAFISNIWSRVGYDVNKINKCVILRGNIPQNGFYEYKGRNLILSSFQMTEENMKQYIKLIEIFNPDFLQAYPSSIHLLSKYILRNNINVKFHKLKCVLCSSENLYKLQKQDIEQAFGVRVFSFYGHAEHACIAGGCEQSDYFHIQNEYGYTEIINKYGQEVSCEDEIGEIVVTGFNNFVIPFIRYRTGDLVVNTNERCECGRNYRLIKKIDGRKQDYFVDRSWRIIPSTWSDYPLWLIKQKISSYQYIQSEPGKLILNIQCYDEIVDEEIKAMKDVFGSYYPAFDLKICIVEYIERTKRGKFKFLIQNLDFNKLEGK
ncbi:phenylacetate--CoA ligase family protein [Candidatus Clostridium radicumherbarum]|uniref:Phenylacetate--CoA ligase family protein n=1 Tax=Candidatus Clostridium radicumherbarum TaxID=3381662 RepID=A0ABW8TPT9_9CLOT